MDSRYEPGTLGQLMELLIDGWQIEGRPPTPLLKRPHALKLALHLLECQPTRTPL